MEETWGFWIDITYVCFHRCRHCCVKAFPNGPSMPWEKVEDLLRQINDLQKPYGLALTGGDIFRYTDQGKCLGDILGLAMSLPGAKDYWRGLKLFFSPFGPKGYNSPTPLEILEVLSPFIEIGFCQLSTSYNLYSGDNIDDRLSYTLPRLFKLTDQVTIVVTVDKENDSRTGRRLYYTLNKLGFLPNQVLRSLAAIGLFGPTLFFFKGDQKIEIAVNPTSAVGRAKNLKDLYDFPGKDDCPRSEPVEKDAPRKLAYITLKGNALPCYSVFPDDLSPLGNVWQEPLDQILSRWDNYREQLREHFRLNYSLKLGDFCAWCVKTFRFRPRS